MTCTSPACSPACSPAATPTRRDAVPEAAISELEAAAVADLFRDERTLARMTHLLETGRPLRN